GCRRRTRTSAYSARRWSSTRTTSRASTSARVPARCSRARTKARRGTRSRATCRESPRSTWRYWTDVTDVRLPGTLTPLFPGLSRHVEVEASTVLEAIDRLEAEWPGLRDRLVAEGPTLRS